MTMLRKALMVSLAAFLAIGMAGHPSAQQAGIDGKDFDPVTRALSSKNPSIPDPSQPAATPGQPAPLTPDQLAEQERQKQLAEIAAKKEAAKAKAVAAEKARKEKEAAQKAADAQKAAALKSAREARLAQFKQNRTELASLLKEQKDARKAYQEARKNATGDASTQLEADYNKAEKDREAKIRELRHPKFKPLKDFMNGSGGTTGTTALPGTVTSGNGPTVTQH